MHLQARILCGHLWEKVRLIIYLVSNKSLENVQSILIPTSKLYKQACWDNISTKGIWNWGNIWFPCKRPYKQILIFLVLKLSVPPPPFLLQSWIIVLILWWHDRSSKFLLLYFSSCLSYVRVKEPHLSGYRRILSLSKAKRDVPAKPQYKIFYRTVYWNVKKCKEDLRL